MPLKQATITWGLSARMPIIPSEGAVVTLAGEPDTPHVPLPSTLNDVATSKTRRFFTNAHKMEIVKVGCAHDFMFPLCIT